MKHIFPDILILSILIFLMFAISNITNANLSLTKPFGGKVTNTTAVEIQNLETANYGCIVPGTSITIDPIRSSYPKSYVIPAAVISKTKNTIIAGQNIMGLYNPIKTSVTCIYRGYPPVTAVVNLDTITLLGTSSFFIKNY